MRAERKPRPKKKKTRPMLTRADLRYIMETAASVGISDEEAFQMGREGFGVTDLRYLNREQLTALCQTITDEGERRLEQARKAEEIAKLEAERAAAARARRSERERRRVLAIRRSWSENCNQARKAARRRRRAGKRRKKSAGNAVN